MSRPLRIYATLTAAATFLLLIAGGLVTSTDSGLAVPDWPLSYGTWFPPMIGGILFEHGHRMIAGVVGLLILGLAVWVWRAEPRRWLRRLVMAAAIGVILQALLGGLTVLLLLPPAVSIAHACLGQAVFCLVVCTAYGLRTRRSSSPLSTSLHLHGVLVAGLAAAQLFLGAVLRHTGQGVMSHILVAVSLLGAVAALARRVIGLQPRSAILRGHVLRLLLLLGVQVAVGTVVFAGHRGSVIWRTAHVGLGALVLAQSLLLAWETTWLTPGFAAREWRQRLRDYLELTKPRLSLLVLVTTGVGFWLGLPLPDRWPLILPTLLGTGLVVAGANALNQWGERDFDALMERTKHRPLPEGRIEPAAALWFGLVLSVVGFAVLTIRVHPLPGLLAAVSWVSYVLIYTPLKRRTPLCTLVGAIPGALPPVIGWAGARHGLGFEAWALFLLLFIWQLPHFLSLAVIFREDYARAGFKMLPLAEQGGPLTSRQTALYGLTLLPVSLFPAMVGVAGTWYFLGALVLSGAFLMLVVRAAWRQTLANCRHVFLASVLYLPTLLILLAANRASR